MSYILKAHLVNNETCALQFDSKLDVDNAILELRELLNRLPKHIEDHCKETNIPIKSGIRMFINKYNNSTELDKVFISTIIVNCINNKRSQVPLSINNELRHTISLSYFVKHM